MRRKGVGGEGKGGQEEEGGGWGSGGKGWFNIV